MKDWKKIASASNLQIPEAEFDRISPPLDSLEKSFRPLAGSIPFQVGPAFLFRVPVEEEQK